MLLRLILRNVLRWSWKTFVAIRRQNMELSFRLLCCFQGDSVCFDWEVHTTSEGRADVENGRPSPPPPSDTPRHPYSNYFWQVLIGKQRRNFKRLRRHLTGSPVTARSTHSWMLNFRSVLAKWWQRKDNLLGRNLPLWTRNIMHTLLFEGR